jgi:DNA-binding CsgD family transcriptional regulator
MRQNYKSTTEHDQQADRRNRSIAYFALFAAWYLAVAFRGSTLHAFWAQKGVLPGDAFEDWSILAHVAGLVLAGLLCTSPARSRQVMIASMSICLGAALSLLLPVPSIWIAAMVIAAFFGGVVIAAWASDFRQFTPPGRRLSTAAQAIMLGNLLMIAINGITSQISPVAGFVFAAVALAGALLLVADPRHSGQAVEAIVAERPGIPSRQLKKSLLALYLFVVILSVNSGLMYRIVLPAYAPATFFRELYWALPYIAVVYVLFRLPARINKSYILYLAIVAVGLSFVLFFSLNRSLASFLVINTLMLGAFGVCDLFWWTILGEMLTFTDKPVQIFGIGLSANVLGIGIGVVIGQFLPEGEAGAQYPLIIALAVVMVTLMVLPLLYGRLASVVGDNDFVVGLNRDLARKAAADADDIRAKQQANPTSADAGADVLRERFESCGLTLRERQIAGLLQKGLTYQSIGQELGISENTVKSHIKSLYAKLRVSNKSEFIRQMRDILE